jgi:hypothetical protein
MSDSDQMKKLLNQIEGLAREAEQHIGLLFLAAERVTEMNGDYEVFAWSAPAAIGDIERRLKRIIALAVGDEKVPA